MKRAFREWAIVKIAIIGDIHGCWNDSDTRYFNASEVDGILFTGDLPRITGEETFSIAASIARLEKPFALIAGNHDCTTLAALAGEIGRLVIPSKMAAGKIERRYRRLQEMLGDRLIGYSSTAWDGFTVVGARPFSMDGERLSYAPALERLFGVKTLAASADRITTELQAASGPVVVLAHNGPRGLGVARNDMYGIDFRSAAGDNGDIDLAAAIAASKADIRMVVAGHMHHAVRGMPGIRRQFWRERDGILYVNGARVPRYEKGNAFYLLADITPQGISLAEIAYDRTSLVAGLSVKLMTPAIAPDSSCP